MEQKYLVTFFLMTLFFFTSSESASRDASAKSNAEFIKSSCVATTYPRLCFSSLSVHASAIQSSPQLLASTALGVSLSSAKATSATLQKLSLTKGLKPRETGAMKDCLEELSDSVDELQKSMAEMGSLSKGASGSGSKSFGLVMSDVQTWVSAALTDESTCTDGFDERSMTGDLKTAVRGQVVNVAQLTSNALALINRYALIHG